MLPTTTRARLGGAALACFIALTAAPLPATAQSERGWGATPGGATDSTPPALGGARRGWQSLPKTAPPPEYPKCSQTHAGRQNRVEMVYKNGDSRMTDSVAGHITLYAVERYGLEDLVTEADIKAARKRMYDFLKWKFYSPSGVMTEFVANGYQHFDKGYVDEAAASLLGILEIKESKPWFVMPPWIIRYIASTMSESPSQAAVSTVLRNLGIPSPYQDDWAKKVYEQIVAKSLDTVATVEDLMPRNFDIDNRAVELAIASRKQAMAEADDNLPVPGRSGELGGKSAQPDSASAARLADLERRLAELEKRMAAVEARRGGSERPSP